MKPIAFTCDETLPLAPEDIARQILDLTKWPDFHGYGPIPGIKAAEFDVQTPGIIHAAKMGGNAGSETEL